MKVADVTNSKHPNSVRSNSFPAKINYKKYPKSNFIENTNSPKYSTRVILIKCFHGRLKKIKDLPGEREGTGAGTVGGGRRGAPEEDEGMVEEEGV